MKFTYRQTLLAVFLLGIVCTVGSFFAQYVMGLNPCPLCILQRVAVMSVMLVSGLCLLLPTAKRPAGQPASLVGTAYRVLPNLAAKPARRRTAELRRTVDVPPERLAAVRLVAFRGGRLRQLRRTRICDGRTAAGVEPDVLRQRIADRMGNAVQTAPPLA